MTRYSPVHVRVDVPAPDIHGDDRAVVLLRGGRAALGRDDVSYAGWLQLCQAARGATIYILVRDA